MRPIEEENHPGGIKNKNARRSRPRPWPNFCTCKIIWICRIKYKERSGGFGGFPSFLSDLKKNVRKREVVSRIFSKQSSKNFMMGSMMGNCFYNGYNHWYYLILRFSSPHHSIDPYWWKQCGFFIVWTEDCWADLSIFISALFYLRFLLRKQPGSSR